MQDEQASAPQRPPAFAVHWHLHLLSDFVTHTSCRQGRNQHLFDKEQTLLFVHLCVAVFQEKQCANVCTKITPVPLLTVTTKRQNWFLNCTRVKKALGLLVLEEVCMSAVVLPHDGVELHLRCAFQDQETVLFFVLDT